MDMKCDAIVCKCNDCYDSSTGVESFPRGYRRFRGAERQAERLVRLRAQLGQ